MNRKAWRVEWMPAYGEHGVGRVRIYLVGSHNILNGVLNLYDAQPVPSEQEPEADTAMVYDRHIPLDNVRIYEPVAMPEGDAGVRIGHA